MMWDRRRAATGGKRPPLQGLAKPGRLPQSWWNWRESLFQRGTISRRLVSIVLTGPALAKS
jgi:hypothetical protein